MEALFFKIDVAFFEKRFSNIEASVQIDFRVASSIGNVKGRDERSAALRALDIAYACGCSGSQEMIDIISINSSLFENKLHAAFEITDGCDSAFLY